MEQTLLHPLIYLLAAVVAVPIAKKLGLGAVLGYLLAGIAIGPWGLGLISEVEDILHFSEFGVVTACIGAPFFLYLLLRGRA